jgi:CO/xanthine dehydrogenase FAD-binding subunit
MPPFELLAPTTPDEAIAALRAGPSGATAVIAGGTDLLLDLDAGWVDPTRVVSLRRLPWRTLAWSDGALSIGSTLPLRALEDDPELPRRMPGLREAVHAVGSVALRHRATLGGNLGRAAPASDLVPMLLALDAEVDLLGPHGARTVPLDRFVRASRSTDLRPHELIRAVRIPESRPSAYRWQRVRPANDISQIAVAAAWSPRGRRWAIAVGGVPPRPVRLPGVEEALGAGRPSDGDLARAAARVVRGLPISTDRRASEEYRRHLAGTLLERAVRAAVPGPERPA